MRCYTKRGNMKYHTNGALIMPPYTRRVHRIAKPRRLISCMQWAALLSVSEAAAALRDWRDGFISSGEAVNHYGGINAVLQAAIHSRDVARQFAFYNAPLEGDS